MVTPRRLAFAAFCTAAAAILVAWWLRKPRVEEAPVARRTVHPVISGRGTIRPSDQVDAFPRVIGRVSRVLVNVGQRVRKEQTIAELDGASYAIQVEEASAAMERAALESERATGAVEAATRKLSRVKELSGKKIASREYLQASRLDVARARGAYEISRKALDAARARLLSARETFARTRVAAPIAGRVVAIHARTGQTVTEGFPVATLVDLDSAIAAIELEPSAQTLVAPGETAHVSVDGLSGSASGTVREVVESNKTGRSAYVQVMTTDGSPASEFRPGMTARARIDAPPRVGVIAVPVAALVSRRRAGHHEAGVFVPDAGRARWRSVVVGARGDRLAEIVAGLREGEWIISGPARVVQRLGDGDRISAEGGKEE